MKWLAIGYLLGFMSFVVFHDMTRKEYNTPQISPQIRELKDEVQRFRFAEGVEINRKTFVKEKCNFEFEKVGDAKLWKCNK